MSKCCKEECLTAFCPHCGKACKSDPIKGLLRHVSVHVNHQAAGIGGPCDVSDLEQGVNENDFCFGTRRERVGKNRERRTRALAKWVSWRDSLQKLIDYKADRIVKMRTVGGKEIEQELGRIGDDH